MLLFHLENTPNKSDTNSQGQRSSAEQGSSSSTTSSFLTNRPSISKLDAKRDTNTLSKNSKNSPEGPSNSKLEKRGRSGKRNETSLSASGPETIDKQEDVQLISFNNVWELDWEGQPNNTLDDNSRGIFLLKSFL